MAYNVVIQERTSDTTRAFNILIGALIIALIIYWRVTGTIPYIVSGAMPPANGKVGAGVYDFITENVADILAVVGSIVVAVFSTLGRLLVELLSALIGSLTWKQSKSTVDEAFVNNAVDMRVQQLIDLMNERVVMQGTLPNYSALSDSIDSIKSSVNGLITRVNDITTKNTGGAS